MKEKKVDISNKLPTSISGIGWPWVEEFESLPTKMPNGCLWPRICIVTPSYNQAQYIEATIRSVLLQGYPNLEFFVMDGGSNDGSANIIARYDAWLTDWVSEADNGQSHAIEKGFARTNGDILTWLNSDDLLLPGALRAVAEAYVESPEASAWVGSCYRVEPDGRIINEVIPKGLNQEMLADWFYGGFFYQPSCFFSARAYEKIGGIDVALHYAMDVDLWIKLASEGAFVEIPHTLSAAVIHEEAKTQAHRPKVHVETMYVQTRHGYFDTAVKRFERALNFNTPSISQKARQIYRQIRPNGNNLKINDRYI